MTDVHIDITQFMAAGDLAALLKLRRLNAVHDGKARIMVCSATREKALGGPRALAERARAMGARQIYVVHEEAETATLAPELAGRLVRIGLPAPLPGVATCEQPALLMAADVIGATEGAMTAADESTGHLIDLAGRVAKADVTVFINGPTGSGKEVLARLIHARSARASGPFIAINCAAIPENMLEAILFGHEKGAFTGASTPNQGIIRAANTGTLLLDEVSEMPLGLQAKLLRVLQERTVTPIGSQTEVPVDIRVIATSNRDMAEEVRQRRFREDLFYRLHVFPLTTRPLNDRPGDIAALAATLIRRHAAPDRPLPLLTADATALLRDHHWPGNVRELENVLQRALVLRDGDRIEAADIAPAGLPGMLPPAAMTEPMAMAV